MGNSGGGSADADLAAGTPAGSSGIGAKEVILCLHSVHNVEHLPSESYYGLACDVAASDPAEVAVTSERPARLSAGLESILRLRVKLHERGSDTMRDRAAGQLFVPIRDMLVLCGPGIYQTWFLLDPDTSQEATGKQPVHRPDHGSLRRALWAVPQQPAAPRVCLSLLEAATLDRREQQLFPDEEQKVDYFDTLLLAQTQHVQAARAYFEIAAKSGARADLAGMQLDETTASGGELQGGLERLLRSRQEEEVAHLQRDLDQVTDEANRRIEKGNDSIRKLKAELKEVSEVETPKLQRERNDMRRRLQELSIRNSELKTKLDEGTRCESLDDEIARMKQEVLVFANQKAALQNLVKGVYGDGVPGGGPDAAAAANPAAAAALMDFQQQDAGAGGFGNILPDPGDVLAEDEALHWK